MLQARFQAFGACTELALNAVVKKALGKLIIVGWFFVVHTSAGAVFGCADHRFNTFALISRLLIARKFSLLLGHFLFVVKRVVASVAFEFALGEFSNTC